MYKTGESFRTLPMSDTVIIYLLPGGIYSERNIHLPCQIVNACVRNSCFCKTPAESAAFARVDGK